MKTLAALGFAAAIAACGTSGGGTTRGTSGSGAGGSSTAGASSGTTGGGSGTSSGGETTSGGGSTTGGCATALCGGTCCAAGDSCIDGSCCAASQSCGDSCCGTGDSCIDEACCPAAEVCGSSCCNADSVCVREPADNPFCVATCVTSSECGDGGCVPRVDDAGIITGPYVCAPDDGSSHAGCGAAPNVCSAVNQYCSIDQEANQFCSIVCGSDAECGNPGVACCDASCNLDEVCCGLCGS